MTNRVGPERIGELFQELLDAEVQLEQARRDESLARSRTVSTLNEVNRLKRVIEDATSPYKVEDKNVR